jgi:hypothetical protein
MWPTLNLSWGSKKQRDESGTGPGCAEAEKKLSPDESSKKYLISSSLI